MTSTLQLASSQPLVVASPIQAEQHIRRMRGGAQSHLLQANDGHCYVVKFMNNPQDVRVLANEMLASRLAQRLSIPVPEPVVIDVSSWLIEQTEELRCEMGGEQVPFTSGACFGSRYVIQVRHDVRSTTLRLLTTDIASTPENGHFPTHHYAASFHETVCIKG